jgi:predicted nuclease with TOPRIM domain
MLWETKAQLRARIDSVESYNRYLQEEVRRQHGKVVQLRKAADETFTSIDMNEKRLFLEVHDMHRDDMSNFALGWNQAVGHVEKRITELLGVDLKSASEEME